jgi:hypothetical protein
MKTCVRFHTPLRFKYLADQNRYSKCKLDIHFCVHIIFPANFYLKMLSQTLEAVLSTTRGLNQHSKSQETYQNNHFIVMLSQMLLHVSAHHHQ